MERHESPASKLSIMENATEAALVANNVQRAQEASANERQLALETRANSPEISAFNDTAELEIYGDKGNSYTYLEDFVDPADGVKKSREVSTADKPYPGKLADIRTNRRFGKTESERNEAADKYEKDVNKLLDTGLELTQAKLVMDLREKDADAIATLAGKYIGEGENPLVAKKRAKDLYAKKDAKRLEMIKGEGLMSMSEYDAKRTGSVVATVVSVPEVEEVEVQEAQPNVVESSVDTPSIPTPPTVKEALENTTVRQAKLLNHAWEKQTGQYKDPVDPNEVEEVEEVVAPIVAPIVVDAEEENDLPPIIVNDDELLNPVPVIDTETIEAYRKRKWPKRVAIAAVAIAGLLGAVFAANRIGDDDGSSGEAPAATAPAPDSGVEFGVTTASLEEETPPTTDAEVTETTAETDAETAQAEAVAAVVANYTPEQQAQMSGDASAVVVAGDVMPSTNVSSANVANQRVTMQAALDTYNLTHSTNFQFGEGDMFWNGDHVINPAELTEYNQILQQVIEEASK